MIRYLIESNNPCETFDCDDPENPLFDECDCCDEFDCVDINDPLFYNCDCCEAFNCKDVNDPRFKICNCCREVDCYKIPSDSRFNHCNCCSKICNRNKKSDLVEKCDCCKDLNTTCADALNQSFTICDCCKYHDQVKTSWCSPIFDLVEDFANNLTGLNQKTIPNLMNALQKNNSKLQGDLFNMNQALENKDTNKGSAAISDFNKTAKAVGDIQDDLNSALAESEVTETKLASYLDHCCLNLNAQKPITPTSKLHRKLNKFSKQLVKRKNKIRNIKISIKTIKKQAKPVIEALKALILS